MFKLYSSKKSRLIAFILFSFLSTSLLTAQQSAPSFEQVFSFAGIQKDALKKDFPHLYQVVSKTYTTDDVNTYVKSYEGEWNSFQNLPAIKKLNIAWPTLGIAASAPKAGFSHSLYQWYKAANVSDATRKELFPHFPLPNLKNDPNKEAADYDQRVVAWQRLYSEEYEHFLNAPELTALNPYYKGYYKLPYLPRFVGSAIELEKPVKQNTGNTITDDYQYQLKLRNWYYVLKPEEFEKLYGKDYKFPDSFDAKQYRDHIVKMLKDKKAGTYPDYTNPH